MINMKNNIRFTLLSYLLLLGTVAFSQPEQTFAFLLNSKGKIALKPGAAYKYEVAKTVFDELLHARGDLRQQAPELTMNDGERFVAWMDPVRVQIGIEEKAYDICAGFGPDSLNALAALLAHELTHYYEKHDWSRNFVHYNEALDAARQIQELDESLKQETQADCLGGFLALSAGYNVYGIMPQLLERLYQSYGLPAKLPGYPGLDERTQISESSMLELQGLQVAFEIAHHLSLIENYEDAARYYRHILQSFQSREIFNNAGLNLSLAALSYFGNTEMPYILPLEPDPRSRLHNLKGLQSERLRIRHSLLEQAQEQFSRAITLDPGYAPAYLNKACLLVLSGEWDDAAYWLKKGQRVDTAKLKTDFMVLEGIIAALQKDTAQAKAILETARQEGSLMAALNLEVLLGTPPATPKIANGAKPEIIDGITLDAFLREPEVDREIPIGKDIICGIKQLPHSKIMVHYANQGRQYAVLQWCGEGCADPTQNGVHIGLHAAAIAEAYGPPPRVVSQPNGAIWAYPGFSLLFQLDQQGILQGWGSYRKSEGGSGK
jgi:tetratricopeptide (TPR) repeat protein